MSFIPYGRQSISEDDIAAVVEVLRSDWLTQGPAIAGFEKAVAEICGARHAVAVANGTAALHLAALALGLKAGDTLWTSPNTFVATANCARYCGAGVDFVDIDPRSYNLSIPALRVKLAAAEKDGTLPTVVAPVHFAGQSVEMAELKSLAEQYGFKVMEDAAHGVGASYRNQPVGNCRFSELGIFSFHPVKIFTTGEGGLVFTNDDDLGEKLRYFRTHGITREPELMTEPAEGPWSYEQIDLGYNYRITDIQCALGLSQVKRLPEFVARRRVLAKRYNELLSDLPVITPWQHPDTNSSWHLYVIRLQLDQITKTRREVFDELRRNDIGAQVHYIPVHTQPYYRQLGFNDGDFPEAEKYYAEAITLPLYPALLDADQERVVEILKRTITG